MMRTGGNEELLARAITDLEQHWDRTAAGWHDAARQKFEQEHLEEMRTAVRNARHAMRNITALLNQVISECS